jgi:GNAT superfamily N-acetyltransferase
VDLRPVTSEHPQQLANFCCATLGDEFTLDVEQEIRRYLTDELATGHVEALGSWDGDNLAALIAYNPRGPYWKVTVLATDHHYRRLKQAQRLKQIVLQRAADAGASALVSRVHPENVPMRALNEKLGGVVDDAPDPDDPNLVCTVRVPPAHSRS